MVLYLDTDQQNKGWETFDYVLNKTAPSSTEAVLERFTGTGYETEVVGNVSYRVEGKYMQVAIPKNLLGLHGFDFTINFSWTDNVHDAADTGTQNESGEWVYSTFSGDILDFYTSGDAAPGMRFKYSYISTVDNAGKMPEPEPPESQQTQTEPSTDEQVTDTENQTENGCKAVALWMWLAWIPAAVICTKRKRD
jgi:hypothetical protein